LLFLVEQYQEVPQLVLRALQVMLQQVLRVVAVAIRANPEAMLV